MLQDYPMNKKIRVLLLATLLPVLLVAQEKVDLTVVNRIRTEATQNSKVMDHLFYLTDVFGPRLSDSPNYLKAADWAIKTLKSWGVDDARLEKWGTFGRSWSYDRFEVEMLEPQETPLLGVPLAWSPSTAGPAAGEAVLARIRNMDDAEKFRGKLKGKFVLTDAPRDLRLHTDPDARRYTDSDLEKMASAPMPTQPSGGSPPAAQPQQQPAAGTPPAGAPGPGLRDPAARDQYRQMRSKLYQFYKDEGVLAVVTPGLMRGDDGTIFSGPAGSREIDAPQPPVSIALAPEHYNRIARLLDHQIPVKLSLNLRAQFLDNSPDGVNVIADIPGGTKGDELVLIGAHLDSWHTATGATDNAAGCAVMLEVVRILTALNLKMDRTVRIALWDAEEQGLLGSRGYVKLHYGERGDAQFKPEYQKLSVYFNYDNGSGKIRGIYLQGNAATRPIFDAWLEPFKDMGASTTTLRNTSGTDHQSFDAIGLPAFQFIQDPLDYFTRTHHTNMDTYERIQKDDLAQSAAIIASFVYDAATRPEMMPRKPLPPAPQPPPQTQLQPQPEKKN